MAKAGSSSVVVYTEVIVIPVMLDCGIANTSLITIIIFTRAKALVKSRVVMREVFNNTSVRNLRYYYIAITQ